MGDAQPAQEPSPAMKVVFFGSPAFAVPTLEKLLDAGHEIAAVVTQPDKPAGRGLQVKAPPVKTYALERGLAVMQPTSARSPEFAEQLRSIAPDVAVVVAYGKILPRAVLDIPRHGCLNVHASLLPKYRGAAPIQWALINGERTTGISIMRLDEGMDTGPVVSRVEVEILEDDDAVSLANMLSMTGAEEMRAVLDRLARDGRLEATPQNDAEATMAPLIERGTARIDWEMPAEEVILRVRGFLPWPKAWTVAGDREYKLLSAEACDADWLVAKSVERDEILPGTIVDVLKGRGIVIKAGRRTLVLVARLQPQDKPPMRATDAVNGGLIRIGTRFH